MIYQVILAISALSEHMGKAGSVKVLEGTTSLIDKEPTNESNGAVVGDLRIGEADDAIMGRMR